MKLVVKTEEGQHCGIIDTKWTKQRLIIELERYMIFFYEKSTHLEDWFASYGNDVRRVLKLKTLKLPFNYYLVRLPK